MSHGSYSSSHSASIMTEDEEDWEDYVKGGYHPVKIGDVFSNGRYKVVRKLGWGHFSTVWLAKDQQMNRHVALKVVKSAPRYTETALDEIKLLQRLITSSDPNSLNSRTHPGRSHVISFLDHFRHKGPNGTHVCMVFEVLGENLLGLIKRHQNKGVPIQFVKQISKQVLLGLDYMHRYCGLIHTDLKPENVLISIDDVENIIESELAASAAANNGSGGPGATKLVGVPPSKGRGGNQTPRSESVFITGSQPLPSPSGSFGSSPMLDKLSFGMSKIDPSKASTTSMSSTGVSGGWSMTSDLSKAGQARTASTDLATDVSKVTLDSSTSPHRTPPPSQAGPSLLSQLAPSASTSQTRPIAVPRSSSSKQAAEGENQVSTSVMSVDDKHHHDDRMFTGDTSAIEAIANRQAEEDVSMIGTSVDSSAKSFFDGTEKITVKIADLGNATWTEHHFTDDIQTRQYRCPEVIIGGKWGSSADVWSVACVIFELITGGDYLFDPASGSRYSKDDDHLAQIMELMGEIPKSVALSGKYSSEFFSRKGELRHITKLRFWPLESVLHDKYLFSKQEADFISSFLNPMLRLVPEKRAGAGEMVHHTWLEGVVVQGEIDALRRMEEEEKMTSQNALERGRVAGNASRSRSGGSRSVEARQADRGPTVVHPASDAARMQTDAMKPVTNVEEDDVSPASTSGHGRQHKQPPQGARRP